MPSGLCLLAAAGYLATQVMDKATTWYYDRQSDASKQREQELLPEGAPLASARKLAGLVGAEPTDEQAATIAQALHQCLGQLYGVVAAALTRRGVSPDGRRRGQRDGRLRAGRRARQQPLLHPAAPGLPGGEPPARHRRPPHPRRHHRRPPTVARRLRLL